MYLTHKSIEEYIDKKKIVIEPEFDKKNIRPVGIRIHLSKDILVPKPNQTVDLQKPKDLEYQKVDLVKEDFYLSPGGFVLGATYEAVQTPKNILAILDGRTTIARLGITTHITAAIADGTFEVPHVVVLEMKNVGNFKVRLRYKDPIAMMVFAELKEEVSQKIQTQYRANQNKVTPPNLKYKTGIDK